MTKLSFDNSYPKLVQKKDWIIFHYWLLKKAEIYIFSYICVSLQKLLKYNNFKGITLN